MKKISTILLIVTFLTGGNYVYADIETDLEAHYKFDEGVKGATVIDSSGNGHNGTPQGNGSFRPLYSTDTPINTYSLSCNLDEQQGSAVNVGNFLDNDFTMSASVWYKGIARGQDEGILLKWDGNQATGAGWGFVQFLTYEGTVDVQIQGAGGATWVEQNTFDASDNQWHLLTFTTNSDSTTGLDDSTVKFYVDGHLATLSDIPGPSSGVVHTFTNTKDIILCGSQGTQPSIEGQIADVRLYSRTLSPADVLELYNLAGGSSRTTISEHSSHTTIINRASHTTISDR